MGTFWKPASGPLEHCSSTPGFWRARFSLRQLLAAVAVLCVACAYLGTYVRPYLAERRALAQLARHQPSVTDASVTPHWLGERVGEFRVMRRVTQLTLTGFHVESEPFTPADFAALEAFDELRELQIWHAEIDDDALRHICTCRKLTELSLPYYIEGTDGRCAMLSGLVCLRRLSLDHGVTDEGARDLSRLRELRELRLGAERMSDEALRHLATLPNLEVLYLGGRMEVTDAGVRQLAALPKLESLVINATPEMISDAGIAALRQLSSLRKLSISGPHLTDESARQLAGMAGLEELRLGGSIGDAGVRELARLRGLRKLELESERITDMGAGYLGALPNLESLYLECPLVGDVAVSGLATGPAARTIIELSLADTAVTDDAAPSLATFPKLASLSLFGRKITDRSLPRLAQIRCLDLDELDLGDTAVTIEGAAEVLGPEFEL